MAKDTGNVFQMLAHNVTWAIAEGHLLLRVPVNADAIASALLSRAGKNKLLASTNGFAAVPGLPGVRVGLNVIAPLA